MPLEFRLATTDDYEPLESIVVAGFENVTWQKTVDERYGLLNGTDWRERWRMRFRKAFDTEIVLVGEANGEVASVVVGELNSKTKLGYIDIIAVDAKFQGHGYGRETLRHMLACMKQQGANHAHLECLLTNAEANSLYASEGFEEVGRMIRWFIEIP
jgi:ribosomal protein S18 acetylase RimI-like enzyme